MEATVMVSPVTSGKRLNPFERYLTIWVGLCMVAGVLLGRWALGLVHILREWEARTGPGSVPPAKAAKYACVMAATAASRAVAVIAPHDCQA